MKWITVVTPIMFIITPLLCHAQRTPVVWEFEASRIEGDAAVVTMRATLMPLWHIYSQYLPEGGPMPTRFEFDSGKDYELIGKIIEHGKAVIVRDEIYPGEITWFTDEVSFQQKVKLRSSTVTIQGRIEYMVCDDEQCIPAREHFTMDLSKH